MTDTTPAAVDKYTSMQVMQSFPAYAVWVKFTDYAALSAQLEASKEERDEFAAAIDGIERSHGLTQNGNLWRFWSKRACEVVAKNNELLAKLEAAKAQLADEILALIPADLPAKVTVQEAAKVLLDAYPQDRGSRHKTCLTTNMVQNTLRAIAGGRIDPPAATVTECPQCQRRMDWHIANFNGRVAAGRDE